MFTSVTRCPRLWKIKPVHNQPFLQITGCLFMFTLVTRCPRPWKIKPVHNQPFLSHYPIINQTLMSSCANIRLFFSATSPSKVLRVNSEVRVIVVVNCNTYTWRYSFPLGFSLNTEIPFLVVPQHYRLPQAPKKYTTSLSLGGPAYLPRFSF